MTFRHQETGDGDSCPQDPSHGRMWFMASKRQWCPSSRHTGPQFYEFDGTTPVPASRPAPLLPSVPPIDGADEGQPRQPETAVPASPAA